MRVQLSDDSQHVTMGKGRRGECVSLFYCQAQIWGSKQLWTPDPKTEAKSERAEALFFFSSSWNSISLHAHELKYSMKYDTKRTFQWDLFTEEVFYEIKSRNRWWWTSKWPLGASHSTQSTKSTIWLSSFRVFFQHSLRSVWRFENTTSFI